MKKAIKSLGFAVLIAAIALNALLITGCADSADAPPPPLPAPYVLDDDDLSVIEPLTNENNHGWNVWNASSTATLDYSIADDGVCTVTVGGTPEKHESGAWNAWKISADYAYTEKADEMYEYKFEAWTNSGTRNLHVQYYTDNEDSVYLGDTIPITTTRTTYTVRGQILPKSGKHSVSFQLADQLGIVNIKMLEIKEFVIGKLTITNFLGNTPCLYSGYVTGNSEGILFFAPEVGFAEDGGLWGFGYQVKGNSLILTVWEVNHDTKTIVPYTGNITVEADKLTFFNHSDENIDYHFKNKAPITFTNGNATINFATQMILFETRKDGVLLQ